MPKSQQLLSTKNNRKSIARRAWLKTYWGQYYIAAYLSSGPLAYFLTEGSDYGDNNAWDQGDPFVLTWIFGALGCVVALNNLLSTKSHNRYKFRLSKGIGKVKWIEAAPDVETGRLNIWQGTRHSEGITWDCLNSFDPEDELEECLEFVNEQKQRLEDDKNKLEPAKSLAKVINQ